MQPASTEMLETLARILGLAMLAGLLGAAIGAVHRWYAGSRVPEGLAILVGLSGVALSLTTTSALGELIASPTPSTTLLDLDAAIFNVAAFGAGAILAIVGGRVGDRLGESLSVISGRRAVELDVSGIVQAVGRVITVDLPTEIEDMEGFDPVEPAVKEKLSGATLVFPRRLTVNELRERLVERLKTDYGVGYVDLDLDERGAVEYLAVGSREAGLGPTLPPESCAVAVRADPAGAARAGDLVQVWESGPDGPERVATGELRGTAGDVATLAVDAADAEAFDPETRYRVVTLPVEPRSDREFASLLRSAEETMGVVTLAEGSPLVGTALGGIDAAVVAVRTAAGAMEPLPSRGRSLAAGDSLYVIARPDRVRKLDEAATAPEATTTNPGGPEIR